MADFLQIYDNGVEFEVFRVFCFHRCIDVEEKLAGGKTLLHFVAERYSNLRILQSTIEEFFGQVNARDNQGMAPLHYAAIRGSLPFVKWLIAYGADIASTDFHGKMAVDYALEAGPSHKELADYLTAVGAIQVTETSFVL